MEFTSFTYDKDSCTISWAINGKTISFNCEHLQNARAYTEIKLVLAIAGLDNNARLIGFDENGQQMFEVNPPDKFIFWYLSEQSETEPVVVCVTDEKIDGWNDWRFLVDPSTGKLTRHCRAY